MEKIIKNPQKPTLHVALKDDDDLYQLAFQNSLQPNIITEFSSGKILKVNNAACKLLGYSKKELLAQNGKTIFGMKESYLKKVLKQRTSENSAPIVVEVVKKTGKLISCKIIPAIFKDQDKTEKAIIIITDMSKAISDQQDIDIKREKVNADKIILVKSKQSKIDAKKDKIVAHNISTALLKQKSLDVKNEKTVAENIKVAAEKSEIRLAKNNEWIKYIAKTSYDVMWDYDVATGEIYVGDSIEEVFGYKLQDNTMTLDDFKRHLHFSDKQAVEKKLLKTFASRDKSWNDSFKVKCLDGSIASTTSRASIVRDENGKVTRLIGAIQDVSSLKKMENNLEKQISRHAEDNEKFFLAAKLSFDVIWDWNLLTDEFTLGEGFEELFGYASKDTTGNITSDWGNYLHPDDKQAVVKKLDDAIASIATHWEDVYRFVKADGTVAKVFNRGTLLKQPDGRICRVIGAMQDISKQDILEETLKLEIHLKEQQIAGATIEATENERSDIGKKLNENVSQLLTASNLYLDMAKRGGEGSEKFITRSSEYTLTAINEIRKITKGLAIDIITDVGLCEAIQTFANDKSNIGNVRISCALNSFKDSDLNSKFKLNIFRIVEEQIKVISKYPQVTEAVVKLSRNKDFVTLSISDNGAGFATTTKQLETELTNIKTRAASYHGTASYASEPGNGFVLTIDFPVIEAVEINTTQG